MDVEIFFEMYKARFDGLFDTERPEWAAYVSIEDVKSGVMRRALDGLASPGPTAERRGKRPMLAQVQAAYAAAAQAATEDRLRKAPRCGTCDGTGWAEVVEGRTHYPHGRPTLLRPKGMTWCPHMNVATAPCSACERGQLLRAARREDGRYRHPQVSAMYLFSTGQARVYIDLVERRYGPEHMERIVDGLLENRERLEAFRPRCGTRRMELALDRKIAAVDREIAGWQQRLAWITDGAPTVPTELKAILDDILATRELDEALAAAVGE